MKRVVLLLLISTSFFSLFAQLTDSIIDTRDDQVYKVVRIGNQWWMAENLRATKYSDESTIPLIENEATWAAKGVNDKAYCFYNNSDSLGEIYGALYTWAAAMDGSASSNLNPSGIQGVCPTGWHLPSDTEWEELISFLGGSTVAGGKMKEIGTTHWISPNNGANNSSGFSALPSGSRRDDGPFDNLGVYADCWSSTAVDNDMVWDRQMSYTSFAVIRGPTLKKHGYLVRCVKDIEVLNLQLLGNNTSSINGNNGSIDLTVIGGLPPYSYIWNNSEVIEDLNGLASGVYSVTVIDSRDSTITNSIRIYDTFIDDREGQKYKAVTIGNQVWMAENLKAITYSDSTSLVEGTGAGDIIEDSTKYYFSYDDNESNVQTYGRLYTWSAIMNDADSSNLNPSGVQGICPTGWHIPSDNEWKQLESCLGMNSTQIDEMGDRGTNEGGKLKEIGTNHWLFPNEGATDSVGFSALPSGVRSEYGNYSVLESTTKFWTSSSIKDCYGCTLIRKLQYDKSIIVRSIESMFKGISVRCVRDIIDSLEVTLTAQQTSNLGESDGAINLTIIGGLGPFKILWSTGDTLKDLTELPAGVYSVIVTDTRDSTITDSIRIYDTFVDERDGQRYKAVKIGNQIWMAENLKTTKYKNGDAIPNITDNTEWSELSTGACCYYNNDSTTYAGTYGALYNWFAVVDSSTLCPTGWHVPSDAEWTILTDYLGGESIAGGKMKETGTTYWASPNTGATNESGFSALPGGCRFNNGSFNYIGNLCQWWSSTEDNAISAWRRYVTDTGGDVGRFLDNKKVGYSIRCLKDKYTAIISFNTTNLSCYGINDGGIILTVTGADGPFEYSWSTGDTTKDVNNLTAGWYKITVNYSNGCIATDSVEILEPPLLIANITDSSNVSFAGASDGTATITPSGGTPPYSYLWDDDLNTTDSTVTGLSANKWYHVIITDANGCITEDSIQIDCISTYQDAEICMVTVNNDNRIIVVWEKTYGQGITYYNIYREQTINNYIKIASIPFDSLSIYIDEASVPNENSQVYKISITDSCGNESQLSPYHKSIHLQTIAGLANEINLTWSEYEGFDFYEYEIYRGSSLYNMNSIRSVSSSIRSWTDNSPLSGQNYYRIMAVKPIPCSPIKMKSDEYAAPFSNYDSIILSEPGVLNASITNSLNISCYGLNDGTATVFATGGTLPYSYLWDNDASSTTSAVTGLVAYRWYHVTVTDQSQQSVMDSVYLTEPDPISITKDYTPRICQNANDGYIHLDVSGGTTPYLFNWSTGTTAQDINNLATGKYQVTITDANECIAIDSTRIDSIVPYQDIKICMVTINSLNQIIIVWEKTYSKGTAYYNIYRRQSGNIYSFLDSIKFNDMSIYIDESALPQEQSFYYKITAVDSCGQESILSPYHKSIHMWTAVGVNGEVTLNWNNYEGYTYTDFQIFRGTDYMQMSPIRTITSDAQSWTDPNIPAGRVYYQVAAMKSSPCFPTQLKSDIVFESAKSNLDDNGFVGVLDQKMNENLLIYPNPFSDITTIHFPNIEQGKYQLIITDLTGKVVKTIDNITDKRIELNRDSLPEGLFLIELRGPQIYRGKIVIE